MSEIIETRVICKQPGRYIGWPTIAQGEAGTLYVAFSGDRDGHVCPFGKSFFMRSEDGGNSWTEPKMINDTPLDDRDTGLCMTPDGTLVMTWFASHFYGKYAVIHGGYNRNGRSSTPWESWEQKIRTIDESDAAKWAPLLLKPSEEENARWRDALEEYGLEDPTAYECGDHPIGTRRLGYWTRRSTDGGETWDEPVQSPVCTPHGPNVLPDGHLIYVGLDHEAVAERNGGMSVVVSADLGKSWDELARFASYPQHPDWPYGEVRLCEPHIVAVDSDRLVGMARAQIKPLKQRYLWTFSSDDGGQTWTDPQPTDLLGFPPHLLRVSDGRLLLSYAIRHDPPGVRFCFSDDGGRTWDNDHQLELTDAPSGDLGYPATTELPDGTFVSIYYQRSQVAEKPSLMMTRWRD